MSATRFVRKSAVQEFAKSKGKWVGESFYHYLDRRIFEIMEAHIHALGPRTKLNGAEAEEHRQLMKRINA